MDYAADKPRPPHSRRATDRMNESLHRVYRALGAVAVVALMVAAVLSPFLPR